MKNYVQDGDTLELTAPAGGVVSGHPVKIGAMVVVPQVSAAEGQRFNGKTSGVFRVIKKTSQSWAEGVVICWDDTAKLFTTTATDNTKCGFVAIAAASADAQGTIKLVPIPA